MRRINALLMVLSLVFAPMSRAAFCPTELLVGLNLDYRDKHEAKERRFWSQYMALADADPAKYTAAEEALRAWAANPAHLARVQRALQSQIPDSQVEDGLRQWEAFFRVNARPDWPGWLATIGRRFGRPTTTDIVASWTKAEETLASTLAGRKNFYTDPEKGKLGATVTALRLLVQNDPVEAIRKSALESLWEYERFVLQSGLIPLIKLRNQFARRLGFANYYEWKVRTNEKMNLDELFKILDRLEEKTRDVARRTVEGYRLAHGDRLLEGWNYDYLTHGDIKRELEPYFPFSQVISRFGATFAGMGIGFRGGSVTMDLVDREGKYPNGFIRAPRPAYTQVGPGGGFRPAVAHFASNAIPGQAGSGYGATHTVLHEAGHFAHFANILAPSVAASQEESPSSVAVAETQSMFMDSLMQDPAWLRLYAKTEAGEPIPWDLTERYLRSEHLQHPIEVRRMLLIPFIERELYTLPESELTEANLLRIAREMEKKLLFTNGAARPTFTYVHIVSSEASAYYHGYVLAELAVEMVRQHFLKRDGHVVQNHNVGPELAKHFWAHGNSRSLPQMMRSMTGRDFSADALIEAVNQPMDEYLNAQQRAYDWADYLEPTPTPVNLNGIFTVAHGDTRITTTVGGRSFEGFSEDFAKWIREQERDRERKKAVETASVLSAAAAGATTTQPVP